MQSAEIWFELGKTCSEIGLFEKAAEAYRKAIEQKLQSGWLYNNLAEIYVQQGNLIGALTLYQKSLELFSGSKDLAQIWGRIGNIYTRLNEYGKAIQAFQKAEEFKPKQSPEMPSSNNPTVSQSEPDRDPAQYELVEEQDGGDEIEEEDSEGLDEGAGENGEVVKDSANVWNELGLVLFKVGAYEDAIDAYQKALAISPEVGYLYSNLGQVYSVQGKLNEALEQYEMSLSVLDNNKDKSVSWTRLGDIYRQLGKYDQAEPAYLLSEVLVQTAAVFTNEYRQVKLESISTTSDPVRGLEEIGELVQSIRTFGIIQPLIVCPGRNEPGKLTLISGRRRLEAARLAGLKDVPVIVRRATNQEILEISISENIHHLAVTPFELAHNYMKMANEFELSIEEISARVCRSCHSVANTMKMVDPPQKAKPKSGDEIVINGKKVIERSLAELQAQSSELSEILPDLALQINPKDDEILSETSVPVAGSDEEQVPTLWYLESEEALVEADENNLSDSPSLLSRARQVLRSNPQVKRLWADLSSRA